MTVHLASKPLWQETADARPDRQDEDETSLEAGQEASDEGETSSEASDEPLRRLSRTEGRQ